MSTPPSSPPADRHLPPNRPLSPALHPSPVAAFLPSLRLAMSSSSPSASVPAPQPLPPAFVAALQAAFAAGSILTSREDLIPYGFDGTAA
jgi:hypothetical protein